MTLTLEQQFSIRLFAEQVKQMSEEQTKDFLIKVYTQMMIREATYQHLLNHQWTSSNLEQL